MLSQCRLQILPTAEIYPTVKKKKKKNSLDGPNVFVSSTSAIYTDSIPAILFLSRVTSETDRNSEHKINIL